MKKNILFILATCLLFICTACGSKELSNEKEYVKEGYSENDTENNKESDTPITVDDVRNHAVSPESDFKCTDNGSGGLILVGYSGSDDIVVMPESIDGKPITEINKRVFAQKPIKGLKLADSVETIGYTSFAFCPNLEVVICGSGLKTIGEGAFESCASLREVILNDGLECIEPRAFTMSTSMKEIVIPETVTTITNSFPMMSKDFKIIGKAGSVAETYATEASITFEAQ